MNVQRSIICKLIVYEFELDYNATEASKNICFVIGEKGSWLQ